MRQSQNGKASLRDTPPVYVFWKMVQDRLTSRNSSGLTIKDLTALAGLLTSNAGKWLREGKSYEITGVAILLSAVGFALLVGTMVGVLQERSKIDKIAFAGTVYKMAGLAKFEDGGRTIYTPVYEELK